jgi:predicted hydrocarbon binding protein
MDFASLCFELIDCLRSCSLDVVVAREFAVENLKDYGCALCQDENGAVAGILGKRVKKPALLRIGEFVEGLACKFASKAGRAALLT